MVKYYGRARQRVGAVNRNQPGLKRQGVTGNAGRPRNLSTYVQRRVNSNARTGCVKNGKLTGKLLIFSNGQQYCVDNKGYQLIPKAPSSRACAGGVGQIQHTRCSKGTSENSGSYGPGPGPEPEPGVKLVEGDYIISEPLVLPGDDCETTRYIYGGAFTKEFSITVDATGTYITFVTGSDEGDIGLNYINDEKVYASGWMPGNNDYESIMFFIEFKKGDSYFYIDRFRTICNKNDGKFTTCEATNKPLVMPHTPEPPVVDRRLPSGPHYAVSGLIFPDEAQCSVVTDYPSLLKPFDIFVEEDNNIIMLPGFGTLEYREDTLCYEGGGGSEPFISICFSKSNRIDTFEITEFAIGEGNGAYCLPNNLPITVANGSVPEPTFDGRLPDGIYHTEEGMVLQNETGIGCSILEIGVGDLFTKPMQMEAYEVSDNGDKAYMLRIEGNSQTRFVFDAETSCYTMLLFAGGGVERRYEIILDLCIGETEPGSGSYIILNFTSSLKGDTPNVCVSTNQPAVIQGAAPEPPTTGIIAPDGFYHIAMGIPCSDECMNPEIFTELTTNTFDSAGFNMEIYGELLFVVSDTGDNMDLTFDTGGGFYYGEQQVNLSVSPGEGKANETRGISIKMNFSSGTPQYLRSFEGIVYEMSDGEFGSVISSYIGEIDSSDFLVEEGLSPAFPMPVPKPTCGYTYKFTDPVSNEVSVVYAAKKAEIDDALLSIACDPDIVVNGPVACQQISDEGLNAFLFYASEVVGYAVDIDAAITTGMIIPIDSPCPGPEPEPTCTYTYKFADPVSAILLGVYTPNKDAIDALLSDIGCDQVIIDNGPVANEQISDAGLNAILAFAEPLIGMPVTPDMAVTLGIITPINQLRTKKLRYSSKNRLHLKKLQRKIQKFMRRNKYNNLHKERHLLKSRKDKDLYIKKLKSKLKSNFKISP